MTLENIGEEKMKRIHPRGAVLMMSVLLSFLVVPVWATGAEQPIEAEETGEVTHTKEAETHLYPLVKYDFASLGSQGIHSPAAGLLLMNDELMLLGFYTRYGFTKSLEFGYPEVYHSIDLLLDGAKGNHQYIVLFKSEADKPILGGLASFQTAAVYGYRLLNTEHNSLVLGAGLAVSDFGIELEDGSPWPLIPVPLIRFNHESKLLSASFDFITGPNLSLTLMPENRVRVKADVRLDQFRDIHDLIFETELMYRFFGKDHPTGDFAGISAGIKNEGYSFAAEGKDEPVEVNYYSVFGSLDITLLKCTGGYVFDSRERYNGDDSSTMGRGFFLSIEGMYQF